MGFITFDGVSKQYKNGVTALYDINLEIEKGDFLFIIGESGSRNMMGIYNKDYDSTPLCQRLVDSGNMFAFTDTISMKSVTALCIPPLLSFMDNESTTTDLSKFDSIVSANSLS